MLTHWGRALVMHIICVGNLINIGSDNGLSPYRRQAIIRTNTGMLLIGLLGTNFSEILIEIQIFSLKKIRLKMSFVKCYPFRLGLNVLSYPHLPASCKSMACCQLDIKPLCELMRTEIHDAIVNSLWPNDTIWRHRSRSTLVPVVACCLKVPRHYLNQCWLIISKVQWHLRAILQEISQPSITKISLKSTYIKYENQIDGLVQDCSNSIANALELLQSYTKLSKFKSPRGQWVNMEAQPGNHKLNAEQL